MVLEYKFGEMIVNGKKYRNDIIVDSRKGVIIPRWWREEGHYLQKKDIEKVITKEIEVIVIGTGESGMMKVAEEVKEWFSTIGKKVIIKPTEEARKLYNKLSNTNKVIGMFHLTC
jgi:hypothetical protein